MSESLEHHVDAPRQPEAPKRALEDIAAERVDDMAAVQEQTREAVSFDDRCTAIGECLMDLYVSDPDVAADLEPFVDEGRFPDQAALVLAEYESGKRERRPDYDITGKSPRILTKILERAFEQQAEEQIVAEKQGNLEIAETALAEDTETHASTEEVLERAVVAADDAEADAEVIEAETETISAYGALLAEYGDQPLILLDQIAASDSAPEAEKAKAQAFLRIRSLTQTEADAALITRRIEAQDFSTGVSEPGAFIRHEIFSSSAHDTGFSEEMQDAVAKEFEILRPPKADTGSEVRALATAIKTDPETGEETPAYTEEHPAEFRPGVGAWSNNGEDVNLTVAIPGHPPVTREVTGWNVDDICLLAEAMTFSAVYEQEGVTGFVEDIYKIDFAVLGDSAFDRASLREIRQMLSALMGSFEGYDGDIFDPRAKIGLIHHQAQLLNEDDRAFGTENSRENTLRVARKIGLQDEDGNINLDVMKAFGAYTQETYLSGEASHAALHARLYRQFPEFVEVPDTEEAGAAHPLEAVV